MINLIVKKTKLNLTEKSDTIKNCFWIPETTPESISENIKKPEEYYILFYNFIILIGDYNVLLRKKIILLN